VIEAENASCLAMFQAPIKIGFQKDSTLKNTGLEGERPVRYQRAVSLFSSK
jgi:hypothetical protein